MKNERCANCRHFAAMPDSTRGLCVRFPPLTKMYAGYSQDNEPAGFPVTERFMRCGEFQPSLGAINETLHETRDARLSDAQMNCIALTGKPSL